MTTSDPRVFFAAERTLLAWVRSSITVMTLGFVVAKFGLFLSLLSTSSTTLSELHQNNGLSKVLGITLIITGAAITLGAQLNHHLYVKSLPPIDVPKLAITWLVPLLTFSIAFIGFILATYLVLA